MFKLTNRTIRRLAMPVIALTLACSDDPHIPPVVETAEIVCVDDTLRAPLYSGGCADLERYFHTVGVLNTNGESHDVAASGTRAYVCDGAEGLAVVDISDPSRPRFESVLAVPGSPRDAAVCGEIVFVASADRGLVVVDATDPASPFVLTEFNSPGNALGVILRDNRVYVANDALGLMIFDVTDPARPEGLGIENTPGRANGVALEGPVAYVSDELLGLRVVSVEDPLNPWLVADVPVAGRPAAVDVEGGIAYIAAYSDGLIVVDASSPDSAEVLTTFDTRGTVLDIAVDNGVAFVADGANGLLVLDVTSPGAPKQLARSGAEGVARGVSTMGSWTFAADSDAGMRVLDASNVAGLSIRSEFTTGPPYYTVGTGPDGLIYAATEPQKLSVIRHLSNDRLTEAGSVWIGGEATDAMYYEGRVYVANGYQLVAIDPTSPSDPKVVWTIPSRYIERFAIFDSTMFVTRGFANGAIFDMRTLASTGLTISAGSVCANATNGYFAQLSGRVWITAGKADAPRPVRNVIDGAGSTRDIEILGNFLFVGKNQGGVDEDTGFARSAGVEVFDLTIPDVPVVRTYIETSISVERIAFDGNLMYVTGDDQGLEVIDVSDLDLPRIVGTFSTDTEVYEVATFGGAIYVASENRGIMLLDAFCPTR